MADPLPDGMPLDEIDRWTVRTAGALARAGYLTVGEVRRASDRDLLLTDGIGRAALREIRAVLAGEERPARPERQTCPQCGGRGVL